jgi:hypothetical protein
MSIPKPGLSLISIYIIARDNLWQSQIRLAYFYGPGMVSDAWVGARLIV